MDRKERPERIGDEAAVAVRWVRLEAQQTHAPSRTDKVGERGEVSLRAGRGKVLGEHGAHHAMFAGVSSGAPLGRRTQTAEVEVADAGLAHVRGEPRLGEPGPARAGDGADINEQVNVRRPKCVEETLDGRAFVADGGEGEHGSEAGGRVGGRGTSGERPRRSLRRAPACGSRAGGGAPSALPRRPGAL